MNKKGFLLDSIDVISGYFSMIFKLILVVIVLYILGSLPGTASSKLTVNHIRIIGLYGFVWVFYPYIKSLTYKLRFKWGINDARS